MRFDVKKFLFMGLADQKAAFFEEAQRAGIIHFIEANPAAKSKELPGDVQHTLGALRVLRGLPVADQVQDFGSSNAEETISAILELQKKQDRLLESIRLVNLEIARVGVFGDFSIEELHSIEEQSKRTIQFLVAKKGVFHDQPLPDEVIFVDSDHGLDYYIAINPEAVSYPKMTEIKIEHPIGVLKEQLQAAKQESHAVEQILKGYQKFSEVLHAVLISQLNRYNLHKAETNVQTEMDGLLFAAEGWVPVNKMPELNQLVAEKNLHVEEIKIEPQDAVPTYLENRGAERIGEDLVNIYDTPSSTDKDPSMWVLGGFALFFSMIIGDAGYGLIYLSLALFLRYKFADAVGLKKRMINLFLILSTGCIVWGVLTTSFFGMTLDAHNPINKVSLIHWLAQKKAAYHVMAQDETYQKLVVQYPDLDMIDDPNRVLTHPVKGEGDTIQYPILNVFKDNIMMELALFVGLLHIISSLLRYIGRNWVGIGWIAFLVGGYLYFPLYLGVPSLLNFVGGVDLVKGGEIGFWVMLGGIAFAWIGSIITDGFTGIFAFTKVIEIFADLLSYLRLYALGLAGAIVSATINEIAGALPALFGILLIFIGHTVNIALGVMSGVIHGLRLNFLEWYHYSFEGGGRQFLPLKLLKKE